MGKKNNDVLTGVPKYFYDLDNVLNTKTKTEGAFKAATDLLDAALGGEFVFKGDNGDVSYFITYIYYAIFI